MHEIERRFLVADPQAALTWSDANRVDPSVIQQIEQAYLFDGGDITLRVRKAIFEYPLRPGALPDIRGTLTIKLDTPMGSMIREEFNHPVSIELVERQLARYPHRVIKCRRLVYRRAAEERWEVDVFGGANEGLVLAEIELRAPDQQIELPPWVGAEVTDDPRYTNAALARHPFQHWS